MMAEENALAYDPIQVERQNQTGDVTLNRPAALNALNITMWQELQHVCTRQEKPKFKGR